MTREECGNLLRYILADYDVQITIDRISVWYDQIKDLEIGFAKQVADILLKEQHFGTPKVASFVRILRQMTEVASGELTAGEAWEKAIGAVRKWGLGRESDALASLNDYSRLVSVIRQVSWRSLCMTEDDGLPFLEKRFIEYYEAMKAKEALHQKIGEIGMVPSLTPISDQGHNVKQLVELKNRAGE